MKSLYEEISDLADSVEAAAALLRRMASGDANAAIKLADMCNSVAYSGYVLSFPVDRIIAEVLSDDDEAAEG